MSAPTTTPEDRVAVYVVSGTDSVLVDRGLDRLLAELTSHHLDGAESQGPAGRGEQPAVATPAVAIEEHRAPSGDEDLLLGPVIDALFTPPFLADRRLVVLRDAERLDASQASELASRIGEPFSPNVLVLVVVGKALPTVLAKAVKALKARGKEIDTSPGSSGRERTQWVGEQLQAAPVNLDAAARHLLEQHLGEDVSRLHSLVEILSAAYGVGGTIGPAELVPFLGEEGGAPPWDLTDALDRGEVAKAVQAAHRLLGPGGRHPFQVLATLHRHYGAMLRLEGSGVTDPGAAASLLKMSPYPARKVLDQGRRLGAERVARAVSLIADADHDLRGVVDWPADLVIEVLVARLAQLARSRSGANPATSPPGASSVTRAAGLDDSTVRTPGDRLRHRR